MKNQKSMFRVSVFAITILLICSGNLYSQKLKVSKDYTTGENIYLTNIIYCAKGNIIYKCYLQRWGDSYELQLEIEKSMCKPFEIIDSKPALFILSSNDTIVLYPKNYSTSGSAMTVPSLLYAWDKKSSLDYNIDISDIKKLRDNDLAEVKIYYRNKDNKQLTSTYKDDSGYYFKLKFKKKFNKKINKRITGLLEAQ